VAAQADHDGKDGEQHGDQSAERLSRDTCGRPRLPRKRLPDAIGIERRVRIAGDELEQRGELPAMPDARQDHGREIAARADDNG